MIFSFWNGLGGGDYIFFFNVLIKFLSFKTTKGSSCGIFEILTSSITTLKYSEFDNTQM